MDEINSVKKKLLINGELAELRQHLPNATAIPGLFKHHLLINNSMLYKLSLTQSFILLTKI